MQVEIWRGRRTAIAAYGRTQTTAESPLDSPLYFLALGIVACLLGLLALDYALRRFHLLWKDSEGTFSPAGKILGTSALTAAFAGAALAKAQETAPSAFFLLWALGTAVAAGGAAVLRLRRRSDR